MGSGDVWGSGERSPLKVKQAACESVYLFIYLFILFSCSRLQNANPKFIMAPGDLMKRATWHHLQPRCRQSPSLQDELVPSPQKMQQCLHASRCLWAAVPVLTLRKTDVCFPKCRS